MVAELRKKANREFFTDKLLFKIVGIVLLSIIVILVISDIKIYQKKKQLISEIASYQKQIEDIKNSSQTLKDEIANSNNADYLEKLAYEQLGEQKPGEKEVIFINPKETPKAAAPQENIWDSKTWTGWLSDAWSWLKSIF